MWLWQFLLSVTAFILISVKLKGKKSRTICNIVRHFAPCFTFSEVLEILRRRGCNDNVTVDTTRRIWGEVSASQLPKQCQRLGLLRASRKLNLHNPQQHGTSERDLILRPWPWDLELGTPERDLELGTLPFGPLVRESRARVLLTMRTCWWFLFIYWCSNGGLMKLPIFSH